MLVPQLTPFTCVLACLESFLRDSGLSVNQAEMLLHHRDLCWKEDVRTYGSILPDQLEALVRRYLFKFEILEKPSAKQLADILAQFDHTVFILTRRFEAKDGQKHCVRIKSIDDENIVFMDPKFPYGAWGQSSMKDLLSSWEPTFVKIFPFPSA